MSQKLVSVPFVCARCLRSQAHRRALQKRPFTTNFLRPSTKARPPQSISSREGHRGSTRLSTTSSPKAQTQAQTQAQHDASASKSSLPKAPWPPEYTRRLLTWLPSRRLIAVYGKDTTKFLQGLLTADINQKKLVEAFSKQHLIYAAALDAKGRMHADMLIYPWNAGRREPGLPESGEEFGVLLEVDERVLDATLSHLKKHKLRSKVKLELLDNQTWHVAHGSNIQVDEHGVLPSDNKRTFAFADPRWHAEEQQSNHRYIVGTELSNVERPWSPNEYKLHRMLNAITEGPEESIPGSSLAYDSNIDIHGGIDFHKGCYVGQELVIRTKHTGVVRKRVLPVLLSRYGEGSPSVADGASIETLYSPDFFPPGQLGSLPLDIYPSTGRPRPTGKLLARVGNIGLALVRLEAMTSLRISEEELQQEPKIVDPNGFYIKIGDADVAGQEKITVQALVPGWMRELVEPKPKAKREARKIAMTPDEEELLEEEDNFRSTSG